MSYKACHNGQAVCVVRSCGCRAHLHRTILSCHCTCSAVLDLSRSRSIVRPCCESLVTWLLWLAASSNTIYPLRGKMAHFLSRPACAEFYGRGILRPENSAFTCMGSSITGKRRLPVDVPPIVAACARQKGRQEQATVCGRCGGDVEIDRSAKGGRH